MRIDVALVPRLLPPLERSAVIVVDVLRATTTLVAMFDAGLDAAAVCGAERGARRLARERGWLLCGEVRGLPPPGFDFGNSPCEMAAADLRGRQAVMYTTNGTRAFLRAVRAPVVLAGALVNRDAAARRALAEAEQRSFDIEVLCAGLAGGARAAAEDVLAAGAIVEALAAGAEETSLGDGALVATAAWERWRGDVEGALRSTPHGRYLLSLGFERDLAFVARLDTSRSVPVLTNEDGVLLLATSANGSRDTHGAAV